MTLTVRLRLAKGPLAACSVVTHFYMEWVFILSVLS